MPARARRILYAVPDTWTLRHCDTIIAVSQASKRRMMRTQGLRPEAFTVIPNGADVPEVDEAARRQAATFTWARTATATVHAYRDAVGGSA